MAEQPIIIRLTNDDIVAASPTLAALLLDAIQDGASVGYMADLTLEQAQAYWDSAAKANDGRAVLVCQYGDEIAGVVQVIPAGKAFQPHRAEIAKLIVHRRARGHGLATSLMQAAEQEARRMGKTVLTLFTRHGGDAERLYEKLGWSLVGVIPEDSLRPDGSLCDASIFYKRLV
jgi:GNAT superfamily N-acetyltransferase